MRFSFRFGSMKEWICKTAHVHLLNYRTGNYSYCVMKFGEFRVVLLERRSMGIVTKLV